jgi:hypothetical protein
LYTLAEKYGLQIKGGPGSGNYNGPGSPRFAHEDSGIDTIRFKKGIGSVDISEEAKTPEYVEITKKVVGAITKQHEDLLQFDGIRSILDSQGKFELEPQKMHLSLQIDKVRGSHGSHDPATGKISVCYNQKVLFRDGGSPSFGGMYVEQKIKDGAYSTPVEKTYAHEFGHFVRDRFIINKELHSEWLGVSKGLSKSETKKVSWYSSSNDGELFAESFAGYTHSNYKTGLLPKPIEDFMVKNIGTRGNQKSLDAIITKAKPKPKQKPLSREQLEFVFRETTTKFEKKFQQTMIEYFKDQEKAALSVLKKGFEDIEIKGGPGSGNYSGPGQPRFAHEGKYESASFDSLKKEFDDKGSPFDKSNIKLEAFRVGSEDKFDRGTFFSSDESGAQQYASLHAGLKVEKYDVVLDKALIAGHQNSVTKLFFSKSYGDMIDGFGGGPEASRKMDKKIRTEGMKRGYAGIVYTKPAPPAKMEVVVFSKNDFQKAALSMIPPNKSFNPSNSSQDKLLSDTLGLTRVFGIGPVLEGIKGGPGSGSWEGPGDPRFADGREDNKTRNLTQDESQTLESYKMYGWDVNNALRHYETGSVEIGDEDRKISFNLKMLDSAFSKSSEELQKSMTVYRGVKAGFKLPELFVEKGFTSTTLNKNVAEMYAGKDGAVIAIKLPKGLMVSRLKKYVADMEEELLIRRDMSFKKVSEGQYIINTSYVGYKSLNIDLKKSNKGNRMAWGEGEVEKLERNKSYFSFDDIEIKGGPGSGWFREGGHVGESGPKELFHGTTRKVIERILEKGLTTERKDKLIFAISNKNEALKYSKAAARDYDAFTTDGILPDDRLAAIVVLKQTNKATSIGGESTYFRIQEVSPKDILRVEIYRAGDIPWNDIQDEKIKPIEIIKKDILSKETFAVVPMEILYQEDVRLSTSESTKSYFPFDDIEEHLLSPSLGLTRIFPRRKKVVQKGGSGSGSWNGPDDPRFAREEKENLFKEITKAFEEATNRLSNEYDIATKDEGNDWNTIRFVNKEKGYVEQTLAIKINKKKDVLLADVYIPEKLKNKGLLTSALSSIRKLEGISGVLRVSVGMNIKGWDTIARRSGFERMPWSEEIKSITKASPKTLPDRFDFSGWAYKDSEWNKRLQEEGGLFIKEVYGEEGKRVWDDLVLRVGGLEGAFDIDNPLVQEFIKEYSYKFAQGINETTVGMLQGAMSTGMSEGLGMDGIAKLIRGVFDNCTKYRSLLIARTETIRASNGAAREAYRQSEVVEGMEWLTTADDRKCSFCAAMDGKVVGLDENFFELGDKLTVGSGANKITMKFDYEAVGYPPLHVQCRCTVIPKVYAEYEIPKEIGLGMFLKHLPGQHDQQTHGRGGKNSGWDKIKDMVTSSALVADVEKAIEDGKTAKEFASSQFEKYKHDPSVFWHGTASGDLRGGPTGLHVGTYLAAEQALDATIGVPVDGFWDGTREYGKTLIAGQKRLLEIDPRGFNRTGHNADSDVPQENYFPNERKRRASFSNKEDIPLTAVPNIFPLKIVGQMTNSRNTPHSDSVANGLMRRSRNQGVGRSGFFYTNIGEDEGSISAVVPNVSHIKRLNDTKDFIAIYDYFNGKKKSIGLDIFFKHGHHDQLSHGHRGIAEVLYHGTSEEAANAILKDGLMPGKWRGADHWAAKQGFGTCAGSATSREMSVYLTADLRRAGQYSNIAAKVRGFDPSDSKTFYVKGRVLEIHVPKGSKVKFKEDEEDPLALRFEGNIPPNWIRPYITKEIKEIKDMIIYCVVFPIIEGKQKSYLAFDAIEQQHLLDQSIHSDTVFIADYDFISLPIKTAKDVISSKPVLKGHPGLNHPFGAPHSGASTQSRQSEIDDGIVIGRVTSQSVNDALRTLKITESDINNAVRMPGFSASYKISQEKDAICINCIYDNRSSETFANSIYTLPFRGDNLETAFFDYLVVFDNKTTGKGFGDTVIAKTEALAKTAGKTKMALMANISIGTYSWARAGYDYQSANMLSDAKDGLKSYIIDTAPAFGIKVNKKELSERIALIKTAKDVAHFSVPGFKQKASFFRKLTNFENEDVPGKIEMDAGKAFMLDVGVHGEWYGEKKL